MTTRLQLSRLSSLFRGKLSMFVCRESFEKRADVIATTLQEAQLSTDEVWSFFSRGRGPRADKPILSSERFESRELGIDDSTGLASTFLECAQRVAKLCEGCTAAVDITAFRREELLVFLRMLRHTVPNGRGIFFIYLPAASYSQEWLSRGIVECRSIVGFPGNFVPGRPDHLVLMLGFELDRARALIDFYEPARVSLGHGSPEGSISPQFYERNLKVFESFLKYALPNGSSPFEFSPNDPLSTASALERVITSAPGYNHLIAPLNNKVATLGAGIFSLRHPEIQVVYALAAEYNESEYSSPAADVFAIPAEELFASIGTGTELEENIMGG